MNTNFLSAFVFLLEKEGGTNNSPTDRGGLTKFGISSKQYPDVDIANLTERQAAGIYYKDYWNLLSCSEFDRNLAIVLFDSGVNCGQPSAAIWLQKTLNLIAGAGLKVDGHIGPKTLAQAKLVSSDRLVVGIVAFRLKRYSRMLKNIPSQKTYIRGWIDRVAELIFYVL
jgi:lysozyme family protein